MAVPSAHSPSSPPVSTPHPGRAAAIAAPGTVATGHGGARISRRRLSEIGLGYSLLAPAVILLLVFEVFPILYGAYITHVADYSSIFGSLAVVMVTMSYIYLSAIVFLTGLQLDSLIRNKVDIRHEPEEQEGPTIFVARSATGPVTSVQTTKLVE